MHHYVATSIYTTDHHAWLKSQDFQPDICMQLVCFVAFCSIIMCSGQHEKSAECWWEVFLIQITDSNCDNDQFAGYFCLMRYQLMLHLIYFARCILMHISFQQLANNSLRLQPQRHIDCTQVMHHPVAASCLSHIKYTCYDYMCGPCWVYDCCAWSLKL